MYLANGGNLENAMNTLVNEDVQNFQKVERIVG